MGTAIAALALLSLTTGEPVTIYRQTTQAELLAAKIARVNPRARPYAHRLASAIVLEAGRHELDPAILAAIAWTESYFQRRPSGRDGEIGLWQLLPGRSLARRWAHLQHTRPTLMAGHRLPWYRMARRERRRAAEGIEVGTALLALAVVEARRLCRRWGHKHPHDSDTYAHYNTGGPWLRPGYRRVLRYRAESIRRAMRRVGIAHPH
jgi:hypothetical protein